MKYLRKLDIQLAKGEYKNPVKGQVRAPGEVYEVFKAIKDKAPSRQAFIATGQKAIRLVQNPDDL